MYTRAYVYQLRIKYCILYTYYIHVILSGVKCPPGVSLSRTASRKFTLQELKQLRDSGALLADALLGRQRAT